jgi:glycosyl transferase family 25
MSDVGYRRGRILMLAQTVVINLDRSSDRLATMRAQADSHSLPFDRIRAIDGLALPADMRAEFLDERGGIASKLIVGEVGCYASHMRAWEMVIDGRQPHALVLEDDVIFLAPNFAAIVDAAVSNCPAGWDVIHLCATTKRRRIRVAQLDAEHGLDRFVQLPINACAYVVSKAGARKLRRPGPRVRPVDIDMRYGYLRDLDIYCVAPSIVENPRPDDASSTIRAAQQRIGQHPSAWRPSLLDRSYGRLFNLTNAARSILGQIAPSTPRAVHTNAPADKTLA